MTEKDLLKGTIKMLQEHHLSPTPNNYAVVHGYLASSNDELVSAVDRLLGTRPGRRLTDADCDELYARFLLAPECRRIDVHYSELIRLIEETSRGVVDGLQHTNDYHQALEEGASALSGEQSLEQTQGVIAQLIQHTQAMQAYTESLHAKLDAMEKEVETLRREIEQVSTEAERDPLTGLANRRTFSKRIEAACRRANEQHEPLSLIMADIDFFKRFNDTYGHAVGDNVLCHVSGKLEKLARKEDLVARYGGEEFIVLLPGTRLDEAIVIAERFRKAVAASILRQANTQKVLGHIYLSCGVATYRLGESHYDLIARADAALYQAKADGRNRVRVEQGLGDAPNGPDDSIQIDIG